MQPRDLPELLGLLAYELRRELGRLLPARSTEQLDVLAVELTQATSDRIGSQRPPVLPNVAGIDLARADIAYSVLYDTWAPLVDRVAGMPAEWLRVALSRLLDIARHVLGGQYVPRGRASRTAALAESLWDNFRGNYRSLAIGHHISETRARQLLSPRLAAERSRRQGRLFDDGDGETGI